MQEVPIKRSAPVGGSGGGNSGDKVVEVLVGPGDKVNVNFVGPGGAGEDGESVRRGHDRLLCTGGADSVVVRNGEVEVADDTLPSGPRSLSRLDSIAENIRCVLIGLGLDPTNDPSVRETPMRVAKMLLSFNEPFDPATLLKVFDTTDDAGGIVAQSGIPFQMLCEHHLLPATGKAHIAYVPGGGKVVGLSKLSRLVRAVGKERPTLQESITERVATLIKDNLGAGGVMVIIDAEHTCMTCRGAHAPGVVTTTSVVKGIFRDVPHARQEAMQLLSINR